MAAEKRATMGGAEPWVHWQADNGKVTTRELPRAAREVFYGRELCHRLPGFLLERGTCWQRPLVVTGTQVRQGTISQVIGSIRNAGLLECQGHADHSTILRGLEQYQAQSCTSVVAIGGGTVMDVAKSVAALAQDGDVVDIGAFQRGERRVQPHLMVSYCAIPTTSGTGSEHSENAVIELVDEKRSIYGIATPDIVIADPALTDTLPLLPTIVSGLDALVQALEVLTNEQASTVTQAVAQAAAVELATCLEALQDGVALTPEWRDRMSWGSLLMGLAFAHARLGLAHGLVHFSDRLGLRHGHMVALLAPGAARVQGKDPETAQRYASFWQALRGERIAPDRAGGIVGDWLLGLHQLLHQAGLATSLQAAGATQQQIATLIADEQAYKPGYGIPKRLATLEEIETVMNFAWRGDN